MTGSASSSTASYGIWFAFPLLLAEQGAASSSLLSGDV